MPVCVCWRVWSWPIRRCGGDASSKFAHTRSFAVAGLSLAALAERTLEITRRAPPSLSQHAWRNGSECLRRPSQRLALLGRPVAAAAPNCNSAGLCSAPNRRTGTAPHGKPEGRAAAGGIPASLAAARVRGVASWAGCWAAFGLCSARSDRAGRPGRAASALGRRQGRHLAALARQEERVESACAGGRAGKGNRGAGKVRVQRAQHDGRSALPRRGRAKGQAIGERLCSARVGAACSGLACSGSPINCAAQLLRLLPLPAGIRRRRRRRA